MNVNILITGGITPELAGQFQLVCAEIAQARAARVSVYLASRGGDVTSGIAMYNTLRLLPGTVRMVNMGQCGSIAATLYLAGDERQAMPGATFFLHAACYVEGPQKGEVSPSTSLILAPFRDLLEWSKDLLDRYFTSPEEKYLTCEEAAAIGMVNDMSDPAPWAHGELTVVLNPHGSEVPGLDRFIARLHVKAKSRKASS